MTLVRGSLFLAALALAACGNDSPSWVQVSEHTGCEALNPQFCPGAFGFTVTSDGRFMVGPATGGETVVGQVTEAERMRLSSLADAAARSLTSDATCDRTALFPGRADRVDLVEASQGTVPVYQINPGAICYQAGRDAAIALHDDLAALLARYYPRPFPPS